MTYESHGARLLQEYVRKHPETIMWDSQRGWHDMTHDTTTTRYVVIENTPGYLPDDDDPATFDNQRDAFRYLIERMRSYRDDETEFGADIVGWVDRDALCGYLTDDGRPHDLGRAFEIHETTDDH